MFFALSVFLSLALYLMAWFVSGETPFIYSTLIRLALFFWRNRVFGGLNFGAKPATRAPS